MSNDVLVTGNLTIQGSSNLPGGGLKIAILKEVYSSGTSGGTISAGFSNRTLNTLTDPDNLITLEAGNILFSFNETGSYIIKGCSVSFNVYFQLFLATNDNVIVIEGSSEKSSLRAMASSQIYDVLTVTNTSQQYKLYQWAGTTRSNGQGRPTNASVSEVYSQLVIIKISN